MCYGGVCMAGVEREQRDREWGWGGEPATGGEGLGLCLRSCNPNVSSCFYEFTSQKFESKVRYGHRTTHRVTQHRQSRPCRERPCRQGQGRGPRSPASPSTVTSDAQRWGTCVWLCSRRGPPPAHVLNGLQIELSLTMFTPTYPSVNPSTF